MVQEGYIVANRSAEAGFVRMHVVKLNVSYFRLNLQLKPGYIVYCIRVYLCTVHGNTFYKFIFKHHLAGI